jgi:hypothetical protein
LIPSRFPAAIFKGDGSSGGSYTGGPWKVVLHTTETAGVPAYRKKNKEGELKSVHPHLTYHAAARSWVQHVEFDTAARALRNDKGGVQTNRDQALQVEIVSYSNRHIAEAKPKTRIWVADLKPEHLADIREFLVFAHDEFGVEMKWPGRQAFSSKQANAKGFRLGFDEWDQFGGVCAHQHVPEQDHWDTGALDWAGLLGDSPDFIFISTGGLSSTHEEDQLAILSEEEQLELQKMLKLLKKAGSSVAFVEQAVEDIREKNDVERNHGGYVRRDELPVVDPSPPE